MSLKLTLFPLHVNAALGSIFELIKCPCSAPILIVRIKSTEIEAEMGVVIMSWSLFMSLKWTLLSVDSEKSTSYSAELELKISVF